MSVGEAVSESVVELEVERVGDGVAVLSAALRVMLSDAAVLGEEEREALTVTVVEVLKVVLVEAEPVIVLVLVCCAA